MWVEIITTIRYGRQEKTHTQTGPNRTSSKFLNICKIKHSSFTVSVHIFNASRLNKIMESKKRKLHVDICIRRSRHSLFLSSISNYYIFRRDCVEKKQSNTIARLSCILFLNSGNKNYVYKRKNYIMLHTHTKYFTFFFLVVSVWWEKKSVFSSFLFETRPRAFS